MKKYHYALLGEKIISENFKSGVSEIKKLLLLLHFLHNTNTNIYVVSGPQSLALSHPDQHRSRLNSFFLGLTVLHPIYK